VAAVAVNTSLAARSLHSNSINIGAYLDPETGGTRFWLSALVVDRFNLFVINQSVASSPLAIAGGKLDAVMLCKAGEGDARMTMSGTVTPTTSDFTATMAMKFADAPEGTMTFTAKHERLGDCPAK
jgi:hypothetical protein